MARLTRAMRLLFAAALTVALAPPALGQGFDFRSLFAPAGDRTGAGGGRPGRGPACHAVGAGMERRIRRIRPSDR